MKRSEKKIVRAALPHDLFLVPREWDKSVNRMKTNFGVGYVSKGIPYLIYGTSPIVGKLLTQ